MTLPTIRTVTKTADSDIAWRRSSGRAVAIWRIKSADQIGPSGSPGSLGTTWSAI